MKNVLIRYLFLHFFLTVFQKEVISLKSDLHVNVMELTKVFVYGTLKKGEPNHSWFSKNTNVYYKYIDDGKTVEKYPLIIATQYNVPFILKSPGNGTYVSGEVYEVDEKVLSDLDLLEEHPTFYVREKYNVTLNKNGSTIEAWIYMIRNFDPNLLSEPFYESYNSTGSHGKKYVESDDSNLLELNS